MVLLHSRTDLTEAGRESRVEDCVTRSLRVVLHLRGGTGRRVRTGGLTLHNTLRYRRRHHKDI